MGDTVFSYDETTGESVVGNVVAIKKGRRECMAFHLPDGSSLTLTPDHIVYSPQKQTYLEAGQWVTDEELTQITVIDDAGALVVTDIEVELDVGIHQVFDIELDTKQHNFSANKILVHNKSIHYDPEPCSTHLDDGTKVEEGDPCECPETGEESTYQCVDGAWSEAACYCPTELELEYHARCSFREPGTDCTGDNCCPPHHIPIRGTKVSLDDQCQIPGDDHLVACAFVNSYRDDNHPHIPDEESCYAWEEKSLALLTPDALKCRSFITDDHPLNACEAEEEEPGLHDELADLPECEPDEED